MATKYVAFKNIDSPTSCRIRSSSLVPRAGAERSSAIWENTARNQGSTRGRDMFFTSTALGVGIVERTGDLDGRGQ
jgi:hypothetical protein